MMTSHADDEQTFQCVLAEKERIIDDLQVDKEMYKAELNDAKDFIQQLKQEQLSVKQELDNNDKKMTEKLRMKDEVLAEIKDKLILKQQSSNDAVSRHLIELEEVQKITRKQSEKLLTLEKEVGGKDEELVVIRKELKEQLAKQSDLLSGQMADKQKVQNFPTNKEKTDWTIVDKLGAEQPQESLAEMNITIARHPNELEEREKESQEESDKYSAMQQEVVRKGEGLAAAKYEMPDLHYRLVKLSDVLSATMRSYAEKKQAFQNVLKDRQKFIDNLQSDIEIHVAKLNNANDLIQQLKLDHKKKLENLQSDQMRAVIADKDRNIKKLQADIERHQVGPNDVKDSTGQLKVKQSSGEH